MALEDFEKQDIIKSLVTTVENRYVLTENIPKITSTLLSLHSGTALREINSSEELATFLTKELATFDKHFAVQFISNRNAQTQPIRKESWFQRLKRSNSGFNKIEILKGNVGYIDFWGFDTLSAKSRGIVDNAMQFVSNTDALIIDLRSNGGGSAEMVQFISSYFLPKKTHLNSFYNRQTGRTSDYWTFDKVERIFSEDVPIYILISAKTFSAAEEFAYNFKHIRRATIIGEPSKGGANPWQWFDIGYGYRVAVPISMAINPITKTNWEGLGVIPNVQVASKEAFKEAYIRALGELTKKANNNFQLDEINEKLVELTSNK